MHQRAIAREDSPRMAAIGGTATQAVHEAMVDVAAARAGSVGGANAAANGMPADSGGTGRSTDPPAVKENVLPPPPVSPHDFGRGRAMDNLKCQKDTGYVKMIKTSPVAMRPMGHPI